MMKILGITGGIGAGKSTVLDYMARVCHARVIQADEIGRELQQPGTACFAQIVAAFGEGILTENGELNRAQLAALIFQDEEKRKQLNAIVHPAVKQKIREEVEKERSLARVPFVVIEAALLLEEHYEEICDEIWYIHTDKKVRIRRLMQSRGYSREKALEIMRRQLPEKEFRKNCQFEVDNSTDIVENTYELIDRGLKRHGFM